MRFIGMDLAWGSSGRTGICVAQAGTVLESVLLRTDEEILGWLEPRVADPCVVAIDAPLIVRNTAGRRECERIISRCFGRYHAAAHSSNLSLIAFREGVRAECIAGALGLDIDPHFSPETMVRRAIEVYPHPAIVALFGLERILKYKAKGGRSVDVRREGFLALVKHLEALRVGDPPFDVMVSPRWSHLRAGVEQASSGAHLNRLEDELDSYVCAYVAAYYWTHGTANCRVVGDTQAGYIVTPVTDEVAKCVDRWQDGKKALTEYLPIFVYGTLRQTDSRRSLLDRWLLQRKDAVARGRWEATGAPFPGASFDDPAHEIEGELVWLRRGDYHQALQIIDTYEGVPHLFHRVRIRAESDSGEVNAYAYQWVRREG
jgi:predicted RNase H-like nuclease/gamma-glutamylcyclotransferase (GGCT)/AIG2-like uncharacterized protein YtfP